MVKEIIWSLRAERERQEIEDYWTNRNRSNTFSLKLDQLFRNAVNLLSKNPELGTPTQHTYVRFKIVRDYLIFYRIRAKHIEILTIWDSRRNPAKFKL